MLNKLLYFVHCLRLAGIKVSLGQLITALEALGLVDLKEQVLRTILRSIFAKTQQEILVFEKVFNLCFGSLILSPSGKRPIVVQKELALKIKASGCDGKGLGRSGTGPSHGDLLVSLMEDNKLEGKAKALVDALPWNGVTPQSVGDHWEKIKRDLDWLMLHYMVEQRLEINEEERVFLKDRLEEFAERIEYYLYQKIAAIEGETGVERLLQGLNYQEQDFNNLNETALKLVEQQVKKLGKRLASRKGYRLYPSYQGKIDLKQTLRRAALRGGVPLDLRKRTRRVENPELIVLCDISNSMARYTHFMLLLVWALQSKYSKIRSFVFVDRLAEVSHLLKGQEALAGLRFIGIHAPCSATGFTDYGRVLTDFVCGYLEKVGPKAKYLILGDGKNNWRDPKADALATIARKGGTIYWLNPRSKAHWYQFDSVLAYYQPYCQGIFQCGNLQELKKVTSTIL